MATILMTDDRTANGGPMRRAAISAVLLGLLFAAVLAGVSLMHGTMPATGRRAVDRHEPGLTTPPLPVSPPPPVQPSVRADLTPDQARASNAAMPYADGKPPLPAHFVYTGSTTDRDAAMTCLAAAALYEAGDDKTGEQAVAQVVLNRLRHPAFPKTVCGVVFQGSERSTGCQFTFTCDGSLGRVPRPEAWRRAKDIADAALSGFVDARVGTATHYHTDWVVPYWRDTLTKLAKVGTQIFYRWSGAWGTPRAFVGQPQPFERLDPRLVPLASPEQAAVSSETLAQGMAAVVPVPAGDTPDEALPAAVSVNGVDREALHGSIVRLADPTAAQYVLQLDASAYPGSYAVAASALCRQSSDCLVFGWLDAARMPRRLPFVPHGIQGMSFLFRRSSALNREQSLWNCQQVKRDNDAQCLPGTR